jgi:hypothetical protein
MVSSPSEPGPTRTVMASWWRVPLAPVHRRWVWLGWGLALQAAAVAIALELAAVIAVAGDQGGGSTGGGSPLDWLSGGGRGSRRSRNRDDDER